MNRFRPVWILFPILGSLLALGFRPSETDWKTFLPLGAALIPQKNIPLPDGSVMRFLGVPDEEGRIRFWLGERELTNAEARALGVNTSGRGISATVSLAEARAVCDRLTELSGYSARLPALEEWRTAARGGIDSAEVPWGFGLENPPRGLHFAGQRAPRNAGPRTGYGFRDLAGGLWEWTREGRVIGSAWSERNPETLALSFSVLPPEAYRDADVGMRVLLEAD
ncbi:MAG: SUMF1/EgtB/PvdO family nonheme iron enzyme [Verrucomicrobia bacterium]|nr:SUMF1/EgtB/PvdO family nonheme iron enzyme [Verrucomicrobiota bacterium]MCH8526457.1 formylglycine-generating enzyme family protein [Kiritimatiellia bacterium]